MHPEYSDFKIDDSEIEQSLLNIDERVRTSTFAWKAQFSPQFIEALLSKYAPENCVAYDPFSGSGTVLHECARFGFGAIGTELNPAAYFMAKANELSNIDKPTRNQCLQSVEERICACVSKVNIQEHTKELFTDANELESSILSLLVVLCDFYNNEYSSELIMSKWQSLKETLLDLPFSEAPITAINCDARCVPEISSNSASIVITSPPYINVMNYHQQYRRSVEALGFNVLSFAKSEFGSNRANRANRFYTVVQYCIDMALSIKETSRIAKPGARLIYVVGKESTVLKTAFSNSEIIYRIFTEVFDFEPLLHQQRVFKNRYGKMIYEDILHFKNGEGCVKDEATIESLAKMIAVDMLREGLSQAIENELPESTLQLIAKAIEKTPDLQRS